MLGYNLAIDLFDCDPEILNNVWQIESSIPMLVDCLGAEIIQILTHQFVPQGISCIALISASHIAIHTWPEECFATVDIFSCSSQLNIIEIVKLLQNIFLAKDATYIENYRGSTLTLSPAQE